MLFAVLKFKRIMAVLGVVYLAAVACLYLALAARNDNFIRNGEEIRGTVTKVEIHDHTNTGVTRNLMHAEGDNIAIITYTKDGRTTSIASNPYRDRNKYKVGQQVPLVIHHDSDHPDQDVATVRDHTLLGLRLIPWGFLAAAVVSAWWFARRLFLPGSPRQRAATPA